MAGSATFTIKKSITTMKVPLSITSRARRSMAVGDDAAAWCGTGALSARSKLEEGMAGILEKRALAEFAHERQDVRAKPRGMRERQAVRRASVDGEAGIGQEGRCALG